LKLTNSEGDKVLWLGDFALVVQKSGGSELFGLVPEVGVHVDGVQKRDDLCVFGDLVAVESHVPEKIKKHKGYKKFKLNLLALKA
jgi:hypothetical protein